MLMRQSWTTKEIGQILFLLDHLLYIPTALVGMDYLLLDSSHGRTASPSVKNHNRMCFGEEACLIVRKRIRSTFSFHRQGWPSYRWFGFKFLFGCGSTWPMSRSGVDILVLLVTSCSRFRCGGNASKTYCYSRYKKETKLSGPPI